MTTAAWSTVLDHSSDAGFRAWGSELSAKFAAVGLTQTTDTGQINWATVTRPSASTDGGYEVWRFNDTQQGSAPIYLKIYYGTGTAATAPRIRLQVGTTSNGSGTVSGTGSTLTNIVSYSTPLTSTTTNYPSYLCYADGFLGLGWKYGAGATSAITMALFCISRSTDSAGTRTADGTFVVYQTGPSSSAYTCQYGTSSVSSNNAYYGLVHNTLTNSTVGTDTQVFKTYMVLPRVRPCRDVVLTINTENARGATFSATTIGTTAHTYISLSGESSVPGTSSIGVHNLAMLWE